MAMLDLKITGGQVYDGRGSPPRAADIGLRDGAIDAIGDLSALDAKTTLAAQGRCVSPGFIDVHSHSDCYLLIEPSAPSKVLQGVTTEVVGNCGASAAPRKGACKMPSDWQDKKYPGTWSTVAGYRALLERVRPAVNVVLLAGHNTLRASVIGYDARPATAAELDDMKRLLDQSLDEGARGLSTGLIYAPGMFAETGEIVELAKVVAAHDGIYTSHMRSEGANLPEAMDEAIAIGRESGVRVELSHLKTSGRKNWHLADAALEKIRAARAEGLEVAADRYPYTAGSTDLDVVLPGWASGGGREEVLRRLRDPATRRRIRSDLQSSHDDASWKGILVGSTHAAENARYQGKPLVEAAREMSLEPVDALLRLIDTDDLHTGGIFFGLSEENLWKILAEPYVMLGSDASIRAPTGPLSRDFPHPRAYGSFPKFLRASLDGKTVPLAEAIRKITSLPAGQFRLAGRGVLARGMRADVVVFDPSALRDTATYEKPHQLAQGIEAVVVNGVLTMRDGTLTGERGGTFLP